MRKTIIVKITGVLFLMFVVALVNIATVYFFLSQQEHDVRIVNIAGRQRMLTQRISNLALSVASGEDADRKPLSDAIHSYENSLNLLWHGCKEPRGGDSLEAHIPPAPKAMAPLFQKNFGLWSPFRKNAERIAEGEQGDKAFSEAITQIKENNDRLLAVSDQITLAFDKESGRKVLFLMGLLFTLLALDILFFFIGCLVAIRVIKPLRALSLVAAKVGTGDFTARAPVTTGDEIGELASAFNKMTGSLQAALQKEKELAAQTAVARTEKKQAEKLSRLESQFIATVSHEFLNPLTAIRGSTDLLLEGGLGGEMNPGQKKMLQIAKRTSERLARLVRNLLDVSKIESGKLEVKRGNVDIALLIHEAVETLEKEISGKNLTLKKNIPQDAGSIWADRDMLTQVVINLLSNALKYTPTGGEISVVLIALKDEVRLEITNTGPGIPPDNCSKIFDKFERLSEETQEGTGLGLPIAKDIVDLHKGKIWVESELGKGSAFFVVLPRDLRA